MYLLALLLLATVTGGARRWINQQLREVAGRSYGRRCGSLRNMLRWPGRVCVVLGRTVLLLETVLELQARMKISGGQARRWAAPYLILAACRVGMLASTGFFLLS